MICCLWWFQGNFKTLQTRDAAKKQVRLSPPAAELLLSLLPIKTVIQDYIYKGRSFFFSSAKPRRVGRRPSFHPRCAFSQRKPQNEKKNKSSRLSENPSTSQQIKRQKKKCSGCVCIDQGIKSRINSQTADSIREQTHTSFDAEKHITKSSRL